MNDTTLTFRIDSETVERLARLVEKMGIKSTSEVARIAIRQGIELQEGKHGSNHETNSHTGERSQ